MCIELATQKGWRRYAFPCFISFILRYLSQTERYRHVIRAHLKANLVLYQSCEYELSSILNGDRVLDRIQHGEGGGGGGGGTHKAYGKNVCRALKLNNFADIGATDFIFASFYSSN